MEEELVLQDAWPTVKHHEQYGSEAYCQFLKDKPGWTKLDAKAKAMMKRAISRNAMIDCKHIESAGELWQHLKSKYDSRTGQFWQSHDGKRKMT